MVQSVYRLFNLLLLMGLVPVILFAQDRSFGTLPLVNNPNVQGFHEPTVLSLEEEQRIRGIYDKLVRARGDFRFPVPTLTIKDDVRSVAWMDYDRLEISLEKKAIEVCRPYGDAAIAFLLGHELTHHYEKHAWRRGFVSDHRDLDIGLTLHEMADDVANETEADYLGGFLAYSAGYGMFMDGDKVIRSLYQAYNIPESASSRYPSLADRIALTQRSAEKLKELVEAFEMANYLTIIGRYSDAYHYYRYVLMQYQSREIYNNLGVTALLDAMQYIPEAEKKFLLPIQLDLESTATRGSGMASTAASLIRQAILHFDAAISLDPDYAPAYLNKSCALYLQGEHARARFYVSAEARPAAQLGGFDKTQTDIAIMEAILDATQGNEEQARRQLTALASQNSYLASENLRILNKEIRPASGMGGGLSAPERIDDQTISRISNNIQVEETMTRQIAPTVRFHQNPNQGGQGGASSLYVHEHQNGEVLLLHFTHPGYQGVTAKNLKIGDPIAEMERAYGSPQRTLETPRGIVFVYPRILFVANPDTGIERWATYLAMRL
jgi:tetratricopeptide (TPR) repeat protein